MSTAEIIPAEQQALTPQSKFDRLLQLAIERNAGADQFAALVDAIMKAQREDARLQFEAALGRFREHLPKVFKTKKVIIPNRDGSQTSYSHAELDKAFEIVDEELRKEGLIASWRPSEGANGRTVVTCVFRHPSSGHVEDMATLGGPPDTSGSKTPGQQIGSIVSYLERYTLFAAAGVAPKGMDNDAAATEGMSEDALTDYCIQMQDATQIGPKEEKGTLQFIFAECYEKANKLGDKNARARLTKVYEEKKKSFLKDLRQ